MDDLIFIIKLYQSSFNDDVDDDDDEPVKCHHGHLVPLTFLSTCLRLGLEPDG